MEYIDAGRVVFFANYYAFMHQCYESFLKKFDVPLSKLFDKYNVVIPVAQSSCTYLQPIFLEKEFEIHLKCTNLLSNNYTLEYTFAEIGNPKKRIALGKIRHVCVNTKTMRRHEIPAPLGSALNEILLSKQGQ